MCESDLHLHLFNNNFALSAKLFFLFDYLKATDLNLVPRKFRANLFQVTCLLFSRFELFKQCPVRFDRHTCSAKLVKRCLKLGNFTTQIGRSFTLCLVVVHQCAELISQAFSFLTTALFMLFGDQYPKIASEKMLELEGKQSTLHRVFIRFWR